jgi:hypothetical protein
MGEHMTVPVVVLSVFRGLVDDSQCSSRHQNITLDVVQCRVAALRSACSTHAYVVTLAVPPSSFAVPLTSKTSKKSCHDDDNNKPVAVNPIDDHLLIRG